MSNYLMAFDSETGGLNPEKADLLTVYIGIVDEDYKIIDELDLKLKPDDGRLPITEAQALKINGIDIKAHLANPETITYSEANKKIVTLLRKYLKKRGRFSNITPFGYNVPFDTNWLQAYVLPKDQWLDILHYKCIDVMSTVDDLKRFGWFPRELGSLGTVVEYLGIPARSAHNAKEDTLMTLDVDKKLIEIMKSKKDGGGAQQDLISLLEAE